MRLKTESKIGNSMHFNWTFGSCKKEIRSRIARAKNAFTKRKDLPTKAFSLCPKRRFLKTVIWKTLLHGTESRSFKKEDVRSLESCEMWLWRKVLNITWFDEVLRRVGEERAVICVINRIQRVWFGHTLRHGDLVPLIIEGNK